MHFSQFANNLLCQYCNKTHGTKNWPVSGDIFPFYFQKEPGNYNLKVSCPYCGKEWYVVWDDNPGLIKPLGF